MKRRTIIFRGRNANDEILCFNQDFERIKLLEERTRLQHILAEDDRQSLWSIISRYNDCYYLPGDPQPKTNLDTHKIELIENKIINQKQYRHPLIHQEEITRQVGEMLEKGIIQSSNSPYNSPLWVVPKKDDISGKRKWRIVIDFRKINELTKQDAYPLPNIEEILDQLGKARYFSAFDLASGFHQVPLEESSREKTAFSTDRGHYEFLRMPFGLKNAPATFQRVMNRAFRGLIGRICFVFMDDIIVFGQTLEEHNQNLIEVLDRLRQFNLKLEPDKCEYLKPELQYLGHIITENGVKPNPEKIKAVQDFPEPKTPKQIKQFLGLAGYYRKFVKGFSKIARPLNLLLVKNTPFEFGPRQRESFQKLKEALCNEPILLQFPNFGNQFTLTTDASNEAIGAILSQDDKPVSYASRTLNSAERNYSTTEKELLAIVWAVKHYRSYLYGRKFNIITDHKPLEWLYKNKDPSSRLMRWRIALEEYDYIIKYKKGACNQNADALSRNPVLLVQQLKGNIHISDEPMPQYRTQNDTPMCLQEGPLRSEKIMDEEGRVIKVVMHTPDREPVFPKVRDTPGHCIHLNLEEWLSFCNVPRQRGIQLIKKHAKRNPDTRIIFHDEEIVFPTPDDIPRILREYHYSAIGGHKGEKKTYKRILNNYYWKTMIKDIKDYIRNCLECQRVKANRRPCITPLELTDTPKRFNDKIAMDIVGPLKETLRGHKYILTAQCLLTKHSWAWPLSNYTAESCANVFLKHYICRYGAPKTILTDNGRNFVSEFMKTFEKIIGIQHVTTTAVHPESNGSLERSHQVLKDYLKIYVNKEQNNWDDYLDLAVFNYNTHVHEATKYSPYELVYGRRANLPSNGRNRVLTHTDILNELSNRIKDLQRNARNNLEEAKRRTKERYDRTCRPYDFKKGDYVWVTNEDRNRTSGLSVPFEGPYLILDVPSETNILIRKYRKSVLIHKNRCKFANLNISRP